MALLEPFILRALLAGLGVAAVAGIVGCFVVWRRMAYFGDSLAHSALLGLALGFAVGVGANIGILAVCTAFALALLWLQHRKVLATDTLLGILAHSALSLGMVAISVLDLRIDLHAYLFGDILAVNAGDIWWIYLGGVVVLALLAANWSSLILMSINEDLAKAEGVRVFASQLLLMFLMTVVVAVSVRVVGILLVTSMLIIPAASARQLASSPEVMALGSAVLGMMAVVAGMLASIYWDIPTAPAIVVASAAAFLLIYPLSHLGSGRS